MRYGVFLPAKASLSLAQRCNTNLLHACKVMAPDVSILLSETEILDRYEMGEEVSVCYNLCAVAMHAVLFKLLLKQARPRESRVIVGAMAMGQ